MSGLGWFLSFSFAVLYVVLIFTIALMTFRKGHWVLGIIGFFLPVLWIVGALMRPTHSARYGTA